MSIAENIEWLRQSVPAGIRIIAVSKTRPVQDIMQAYEAGQRLFGENRVQELVSKYPLLPADISWHFIGHLQTNKVKYIAPFVSLIHSIDSPGLLREVNKEAMKNNRVIDCLLQFHIATEETKFGLSLDEARTLLESPLSGELKNVRITGVMGMSSLTDDENLIRREFRTLTEYFRLLHSGYFPRETSFSELSMGMSGDYKIAIEEGSTMIRIGTTLFGSR